MSTALSSARQLLSAATVWDNHACMPLRYNDPTFLPQLERYKKTGVNVVSLNIGFDLEPLESLFLMLASFRSWVNSHNDEYVLANTVEDIERAKSANQLAIVFDIEGGKAVEGHIGLVEVFYTLGVRWMLLAYNKNNKLGGGCQDKDCGLTDYGKAVIDAMERVGMVLCCSHTGYQTVKEAMDYASNPVIFSHSNPRALNDHPRNVPDDLLIDCANTGGVIHLNGVGLFLGNHDASTENIIRHIDYTVNLVGPEHVGLGLDYMFDKSEFVDYLKANPAIFPAEEGYGENFPIIEPERFEAICDGLIRLGYSDRNIMGILGENTMRIASRVWK